MGATIGGPWVDQPMMTFLSKRQEALVHVGVWCLGEFGDLLVGGNAVGPDDQPISVSASALDE